MNWMCLAQDVVHYGLCEQGDEPASSVKGSRYIDC